MNRLTIQIPDDLKRQLQGFCDEQNRSVSEVVCDSLRKYLAIERFQTLRRKVLPIAEAQGLLTDEDVFGVIS